MCGGGGRLRKKQKKNKKNKKKNKKKQKKTKKTKKKQKKQKKKQSYACCYLLVVRRGLHGLFSPNILETNNSNIYDVLCLCEP
jgi:outer membrane biosynthesis protein TonB